MYQAGTYGAGLLTKSLTGLPAGGASRSFSVWAQWNMIGYDDVHSILGWGSCVGPTRYSGTGVNPRSAIFVAGGSGGTGGSDESCARGLKPKLGVGDWNHLVATYSTTVVNAPLFRLYVNGRETASTTTTTTPLDTPTNVPLWVGSGSALGILAGRSSVAFKTILGGAELLMMWQFMTGS